MFLGQAQQGGAEPTGLYTSFTTVAGNTSATKTFTSVDIGTPDADRYVIVTLQWVNSFGARTLNSATINGVSASVTTSRTASISTGHGVFFAKVPTGTSVTVVANLSGTTISNYTENIAVYTFNSSSLSLERNLSIYEGSTNSVAFTDPANDFDVATNEFLIGNTTISGVREDMTVNKLIEDTYQTNTSGTNFYASYINNTESSQLIAPTFSWGGGTTNATASIYKFSYS
jgi:hypothetical protein